MACDLRKLHEFTAAGKRFKSDLLRQLLSTIKFRFIGYNFGQTEAGSFSIFNRFGISTLTKYKTRTYFLLESVEN